MFEVRGVSFSYEKQEILNDISFLLEKGKITGLVAPNGTGKTTLLKLLACFLPIKKGEVFYEGMGSFRREYSEKNFFLENVESLLEDLTVLDHLRTVKEFWKSEVEISWALEKFSLEKIKNVPIKKLSLGLKQSVLLMMYVVSDAQVLLFDEPTNGLDPTNVLVMNEMMKYLQSNGKIIVYSSHHLENLSLLADEILFLKDKKILKWENDENISEKYQELFVHVQDVHKW